MTRRKRVALMLWTDEAHGRKLLSGFCKYARPAKPWFIYVVRPGDTGYDELPKYQPDGVVSIIIGHEGAWRLGELGVPVICATNPSPGITFPAVHLDDDEIGRVAAEYFLSKGFRNFGFLGATAGDFSEARRESYEAVLRANGLTSKAYSCSHPESHKARIIDTVEGLSKWLLSLPRPVCVLACSDVFGLMLTEACAQHDIKVPSEVAILGVDNDELTCNRAFPAMSSIVTQAEAVGFEAAKLLDCLMSGKEGPEKPIVVSGARVITRQSTDILAVEDEAVAAALAFIAEHCGELIAVPDIAEAAAVSRRVLEKRFRRYVGRSPLEELHRVRIERAKSLLATTEMSASAIAKAAGFGNACQLWRHFHKRTGIKPMEYRRQARLQ